MANYKSLRTFLIADLLIISAFITVTEGSQHYLSILQTTLTILWMYRLAILSDNTLPLYPQLVCYGCGIMSCIGSIYIHNKVEIGRSKLSMPDVTAFINHQCHWVIENVRNGRYEAVLYRWWVVLSELSRNKSFIYTACHILISLVIVVIFHYFIYNKPSASSTSSDKMFNVDTSEPDYTVVKPQKKNQFPSKTSSKYMVKASKKDLTDKFWYHGRISDEFAVVCLKTSESKDNGSYLVYDDDQTSGDHILLVLNDDLIWRWGILRVRGGMYRLGSEVGTLVHDDPEPEDIPVGVPADDPKTEYIPPAKLRQHKRQNSLPSNIKKFASVEKVVKEQVDAFVKQAITAEKPLHEREWYHGNISLSEAEERLKNGSRVNGSYLVYDHRPEGGEEYVLMVYSKGQALRWKLSKSTTDGKYVLGEDTTLNKLRYNSVVALIKDHRGLTGQRLRLPDNTILTLSKTDYVRVKGHDSSESEVDDDIDADAFVMQAKTAEKPLHEREWYHGNISRSEAEERLKNGSRVNGSYLVYDHPEGGEEYVLMVYSKGEVLRWKLSKSTTDGKYVLGEDTTLNKLRYNSVVALIKDHRGLTGQRLRLPDSTILTLSKTDYVRVKKEPSSLEEGDSLDSEEDDIDGTSTPLSHRLWYHGNLSREEAERRLHEGAGSIDGSYLVYDHPNEPGNYVLLIHFKGDMLRWKISKRASDGMYMLGEDEPSSRKPVYKSVVDLIHYHRGIMGRPVRLDTGGLVTLSKSYIVPQNKLNRSSSMSRLNPDEEEALQKKLNRSNSMSRLSDPNFAHPSTKKSKALDKERDDPSTEHLPRYNSVMDLIKAHRGMDGKPIKTGDGKLVKLKKTYGFFSPEQ